MRQETAAARLEMFGHTERSPRNGTPPKCRRRFLAAINSTGRHSAAAIDRLAFIALAKGPPLVTSAQLDHLIAFFANWCQLTLATCAKQLGLPPAEAIAVLSVDSRFVRVPGLDCWDWALRERVEAEASAHRGAAPRQFHKPQPHRPQTFAWGPSRKPMAPRPPKPPKPPHRLITWLRDHPGEHTTAEIADETGVDQTYVHNVLNAPRYQSAVAIRLGKAQACDGRIRKATFYAAILQEAKP